MIALTVQELQHALSETLKKLTRYVFELDEKDAKLDEKDAKIAKLNADKEKDQKAHAEAMYQAHKDVLKEQKAANADISELLAENAALKAKNAVLTKALELVSEVSTKAH
jgi:chromosome segregation ATPase